MFTRTSAAITVNEGSQIGEARRAAVILAGHLGFDETLSGKVAVIVTELATNLVQHTGGGGGEIILHGALVDEPASLQVVSIDKGPGMRSISACLRDGHSTAGTAGQGLGAVQRMADTFDIYSLPDSGTALFAEVRAKPPAAAASRTQTWETGVISLAIRGEVECGDTCDFATDSPKSRFIVADGLGHGPLAAEASRAAVRVFNEISSGATPVRTMEAIHEALRGTRGAAVATAYVDVPEQNVRFVGVGNVAAALVSPLKMQSMVSYNGTAGAQIHKIQEFTYALPDDGVLIIASDGISAQWRFDRYPGLLNRHPALIAAVLYRDCTRGRDDVTVLAAQRRRRGD